MDPRTRTVRYEPDGKTLAEFLSSKAFVRGLMGPLGSGKSTACAIEILSRSAAQAPGPDGIRRTRWAIIRNSYPELKSTTLKTWHEWCPPSFGKINMDSPFVHHVQIGDFLDMEVLFLALDRPEDARKLLSLELTGAWVNEAREVPKQIIDALTGRVGRFPSKAMGGPTWSGIVMDTNPPDNQSFWYRLAEEETPEGWQFFKQPSGLAKSLFGKPIGENLKNLPPDYYKRMIAGKDEDWIKIYVHGEYGFLVEGKPVFPMYRDSFHCAKEVLKPASNWGLLIGVDFGLTPAAVIAQKHPDGRMFILDELCTDNTGIERFAELLTAHMAQNFPDHHVVGCWADPAGEQRGQADLRSAIEIMNQNCPFKTRAAPGDNSLTERLEVVISVLNRNVDGYPAFQLSPKCTTLRKGFVSGYHFKLIKSGNGTQTHETPNKNEFSHPHDALQYLLLGSGELASVLNRGNPRDRNTPVHAGMSFYSSHPNWNRRPNIARGTGCDVVFSGDEPPADSGGVRRVRSSDPTFD